ncbi:beta-N-acetylhexosaminidase [Halalkalibacter hemicellulosilyticus]|uniref:Uncharacterized protein n=1 Tax=Halalkalibacter hemicellulosilyticusJCM 9152 TaxID=1236971 RepID=W4QKU4_9BACI|nr:beta-N-acetylhexosaminidase [Halalkalibacter hemicellulosilyticus]GAE32517.1 hypothetical protein JCM9152_4054 [Halalkalibacter hemicellulosilyticusJCM 9152]
MKIHILNQFDSSGFLAGLEELQEQYQFSLSEEGIPITVQCHKKNHLKINYQNGKGTIVYQKEVHFFRALGLFIQHYQSQNGEDFDLEETPQFEVVGPMFDLSRNSVLNLATFKHTIRMLAVMGFDSAMLYMEDTYEVEQQPYFGYMRGRYSQSELQELDDYAHMFGIELIPCIQTLAHLEEFLKWDAVAHLKDTRGVLLVEQDQTYEFIEQMIVAASKPFRSTKIHIGMDEAEELGRGVYLNRFGYKSRFELMTNHLEKVLNIVDKYNLQATMWSDMFIKLASSKEGDRYYDLTSSIPNEVIEKTPKGVTFMYWDYHHTEVQEYTKMIQKHKSFGHIPSFAGGIWVWNCFGTNYSLSLKATDSALEACKKEGVREVFVTLWGDDGYENNIYASLLGLQLYAEHAYHHHLKEQQLNERVTFCTGVDEATFMLLNELDRPPGVKKDHFDQTNPAKFLLWQDVLLGLFDKHIEGFEVASHYKELEKKIKEHRNENQLIDFTFDVPQKLADLLSIKADIGIRLKKAYDQDHKEELKKLTEDVLPLIRQKTEALRKSHREQWLKINKPFGWEVIDIRYGGVMARIDTAIKRLHDYIEGRINRIEELEQERLLFNANLSNTTGVGWSSYYYRIASPNVFFHVLPIY